MGGAGEAAEAPAIREARPGDMAGIEALYPRAFPEEDLLGLVRALSADPSVLSLVAAAGGAVSGHVLFTPCRVEGSAARVLLLGPLCVLPERQRRGIGGALLREGLSRIAAGGPAHVLVLGDPAYYARVGFAPEGRVLTPHPIPPDWREAWRSVAVGGAGAAPGGRLRVPAPWDDPALWSG